MARYEDEAETDLLIRIDAKAFLDEAQEEFRHKQILSIKGETAFLTSPEPKSALLRTARELFCCTHGPQAQKRQEHCD